MNSSRSRTTPGKFRRGVLAAGKYEADTGAKEVS